MRSYVKVSSSFFSERQSPAASSSCSLLSKERHPHASNTTKLAKTAPNEKFSSTESQNTSKTARTKQPCFFLLPFSLMQVRCARSSASKFFSNRATLSAPYFFFSNSISSRSLPAYCFATMETFFSLSG